MNTESQLAAMCQSIADDLTKGPTIQWAIDNDVELEENDDYDPETDDPSLKFLDMLPSAYDFLNTVYDTRYIVDHRGDFIGGRVMVAGGGPTIWVDTENMEVVGSWSGPSIRVPFRDAWELNETLEEQWTSVRE